MKRKIYLFFFAAIVLLTGCSKQFEPELCNVTVGYNPNCTYKFDATCVPKYSYVKLQIFPEHGYHVGMIHDMDLFDFVYYKSQDEENTYYILVNKVNKRIYISVEEDYKYYVNSDSSYYWDHYKINVDKERVLEGDTVTFTIVPEACYYYDLSSITLKKSYDNEVIPFTQSQTNPDKFSFIMPASSVSISVDMKFGVSASSQKTSFNYDEKVIFDIDNKTPNATFDLELIGDFAEIGKSLNIANNITLSNTYELPETLFEDNDAGCFKLRIYPHGKTSPEVEVDFVKNLKDSPENWTTLGIIGYSYIKPLDELPQIELVFSNFRENVLNVKVKYIFEKNNSSQKKEGSVLFPLNYYSGYLSFSDLGDSIDFSSYDTFTIWVEDDNQKYISRKVTINNIDISSY